MQQKILITIFVGILIIAGGWFYFYGGETTENQPENNNGSSDVVARVNGEAITKEAFETSKLQFVTAQDINLASLDKETLSQLDKQIIDSLVNNYLVRQSAEKSGIEVSNEEIDNQMEVIKGNFEDEEAFQKTLSDEGLSEEDLRSQVEADLLVQKYFEESINFESITVTEEEVQAVYEQESSISEDIPELSEVTGQIQQFIFQQKQQELISNHILELREDAEIEVLI